MQTLGSAGGMPVADGEGGGWAVEGVLMTGVGGDGTL